MANIALVLKIEIERLAAKSMMHLPNNIVDLIETKIEQLADDPNSLRNNITRLVGTKESRLRVGDWRIIFRVDGDTLKIIRIASRGGAYD